MICTSSEGRLHTTTCCSTDDAKISNTNDLTKLYILLEEVTTHLYHQQSALPKSNAMTSKIATTTNTIK